MEKFTVILAGQVEIEASDVAHLQQKLEATFNRLRSNAQGEDCKQIVESLIVTSAEASEPAVLEAMKEEAPATDPKVPAGTSSGDSETGSTVPPPTSTDEQATAQSSAGEAQGAATPNELNA